MEECDEYECPHTKNSKSRAVALLPTVTMSEWCMQSLPCQHDDVCVTYKDGTVKQLKRKYSNYIYQVYLHLGYSHDEIPSHFARYSKDVPKDLHAALRSDGLLE